MGGPPAQQKEVDGKAGKLGMKDSSASISSALKASAWLLSTLSQSPRDTVETHNHCLGTSHGCAVAGEHLWCQTASNQIVLASAERSSVSTVAPALRTAQYEHAKNSGSSSQRSTDVVRRPGQDRAEDSLSQSNLPGVPRENNLLYYSLVPHIKHIAKW